jgi:hypothetical protein
MPAEDLRDSLGRLRITALADAMLEAHLRGAGVSKHDKAREVLHAWALEQLRISKYAVSLCSREGSVGTSRGSARDEGSD